jgi:hypothetical protein
MRARGRTSLQILVSEVVQKEKKHAFCKIFFIYLSVCFISFCSENSIFQNDSSRSLPVLLSSSSLQPSISTPRIDDPRSRSGAPSHDVVKGVQVGEIDFCR